MQKENEQKIKDRGSPTDHLANERTFLAWVRTAIAIMGFGFVVVKFSIFLRQISSALNAPGQFHRTGFSHLIGILLVALGALTILTGYIRYSRAFNLLESGAYYHSTTTIKLLTLMVFIIGILLLTYLIQSV